MISLQLCLVGLLSALVTCQPHFLAPDADPSLPPMMTNSAVRPSQSAPAMMSSMASGPVTGSPTDIPVEQSTVDANSSGPQMSTAAASNPSIPVVTSGPTSGPNVTVPMMPDTTTAPPNYYPSIEEIINAFKSVAESEYFGRLDYDDQMLVLELLSAGEVGKITEIMDNLGYERLFTFVYKIPLKYLDSLMQFILMNIQREKLLMAANSS